MTVPLQKRVRFARNRTEYPIPANPARTRTSSSSLSSLSSSKGPATPPPYRSISLPSHSPYPSYTPSKRGMNPIRVHYLLACTHEPALDFDVTIPISSLPSRHRPPSSLLAEPALSPAVPSLILTTPLLPWSFTIYPSNGYYVSVRDVLDGIYHALRSSATHKDYLFVPSRKDQHRIHEAYERRCSRIRDYHASREEKKSGVKRVDFLRQRTRFIGIAPSDDARADVWELCLNYH
ncbi:hypothetical protein E1B28_005391 [Marasmius oreades]|uniref:DUF6699 domain-containing protein n=1 Tax=Marasmius oreades TaxID=181124 RepID=A0A9P7UUI2_9AGAR|nr:uncharacterized protein E1B28_005391 [Marasmius oreades]KAG7094563.1 hypothetical protein E1B28_005391 [Marasmius oreades]